LRHNGDAMLIFFDQRLVILPTPKTGSTALMAAIEPLASVVVRRPPALRHVTVGRYHRTFSSWLWQQTGQNFRVVALMREPESWLSSWYRFRQREEVMAPDNSTRDISFDDFVRGWCASERPAFADVGSQGRFLRPTPDGDWLDQLFRYEEMDSFVEFLEAAFDRAIVLDHKNVSPAATLTLSPDVRDLLRRTAADEYRMYRNLSPD
jgi:hypothetical protein